MVGLEWSTLVDLREWPAMDGLERSRDLRGELERSLNLRGRAVGSRLLVWRAGRSLYRRKGLPRTSISRAEPATLPEEVVASADLRAKSRSCFVGLDTSLLFQGLVTFSIPGTSRGELTPRPPRERSKCSPSAPALSEDVLAL